ncbi:hypothetical protein E2C01_040341 [Portunus trituberculatus]|uniref:Uncharacterized protein n=1 Tax=Portunus trituberculatus TaxID=210409 RepID=A0A5B7FMR7_PORTR|nr:hypothetical protein [Portunus trituberculatus]
MLQVAPSLCPDQGSVGQPRSMRQAPRSPLTLADLRTPSPAPPPAQAARPAPGHRGAKGVSGRRLGGAAGVLHPREASRAGAGPGLGLGSGVGAGRSMRSGVRGASSPHELRLSHLRPATPSPSPPASCSSFYDSINSEGPPLAGHAPPSPVPPSPTTDRLMQVEVAFEWTPVNPSTHPSAQIWPCSPLTPATHPQWLSQRLPQAHSPRPWPPDSLEATGEPETGHVGQLGHARGRVEGLRVRPRARGGGGGGLSPRQDQDLNSRVHQILTRIASGAQ